MRHSLSAFLDESYFQYVLSPKILPVTVLSGNKRLRSEPVMRTWRGTPHSPIESAAFISKRKLTPVQNSHSADFRKYCCEAVLLFRD